MHGRQVTKVLPIPLINVTYRHRVLLVDGQIVFAVGVIGAPGVRLLIVMLGRRRTDARGVPKGVRIVDLMRRCCYSLHIACVVDTHRPPLRVHYWNIV